MYAIRSYYESSASPSAFFVLTSISTISEKSPHCSREKAVDAPTAPQPITAHFLILSIIYTPLICIKIIMKPLFFLYYVNIVITSYSIHYTKLYEITKYKTNGIRDFHTSISRREWVTVGDPTEIALLVAAAKASKTIKNLENEFIRIDEIPFDSETKCMKVIVENKSGERICYAKGALDVIINQCNYAYSQNGVVQLNQNIKNRILKKNFELGSSALRVLGFARKTMYSYDNQQSCEEMTFIGIMAMLDPPRAEAKRAIKICEKANIKTVMITGDHVITSYSIHYTKLYEILSMQSMNLCLPCQLFQIQEGYQT